MLWIHKEIECLGLFMTLITVGEVQCFLSGSATLSDTERRLR
ncbi:hypothetical protein [Holospora curviuscula]|nr:hypothetical protein [Holospora curviuscula]